MRIKKDILGLRGKEELGGQRREREDKFPAFTTRSQRREGCVGRWYNGEPLRQHSPCELRPRAAWTREDVHTLGAGAWPMPSSSGRALVVVTVAFTGGWWLANPREDSLL